MNKSIPNVVTQIINILKFDPEHDALNYLKICTAHLHGKNGMNAHECISWSKHDPDMISRDYTSVEEGWQANID